MPVENLAERLAAANDTYQAAVVREKGELPPDGTYQAVIERFDMIETKRGELMLLTETAVQLGEHAGWPIEFWHTLEDPEKIEWTKKHLTRLGVELGDLTQLPSALADVVGVPVEIAVVSSKKRKDDGTPFRNAYLNQRLGDALGSDLPPIGQAPAQAVSADGDLPF